MKRIRRPNDGDEGNASLKQYCCAHEPSRRPAEIGAALCKLLEPQKKTRVPGCAETCRRGETYEWDDKDGGNEDVDDIRTRLCRK